MGKSLHSIIAHLDTIQYSIVFCLWQVKSEAPMGAHATELINQ